MADKTEIPEHTTKDLEAESLNPDTIDEAAIALKHIATRDMAPITDEENHQILKKIDFYLMPIMIITYALQYYDKGVLNQASLFNFLVDLDLRTLISAGPPPVYSTIRYSQVSMIFYCGYILGVYPATLLAQKYRTGRVCGVLVTLWGVCEICTVACKSFPGILIQRFFLGVLEAGIAPTFMVLCSQFYKRDELALRVGMWASAQPLSNTFAPLISYGLGSINGSLAGWQNIYLFAGACTIAWGVFVFIFLPDDPTRAKIFNDRQRYVALERVRENNAGITNHHIKWSHIIEALLDPVTWLYTTIIFAGVTPNGVFGTFGSIIIKSLGFNNLQALGIQVPSGFIGFLSIILPTYFIRRTNNYRFHMLTIFEILTMIGAILLWVMPRSNVAGLLVGYYLMSCFAGMFALTLLTAGTNTAGHTKKSTMGAMVVLGYCLGNIMAPLIFVAQQAPGYVGGFTGITICTIYAGIAAQITRLILMRRNKKKQEAFGDPSYHEAFTDLTDHKNHNFRYLM